MPSSSQRQRRRWNLVLIQQDMEERGWLKTDVARHAEISDTTVMRFFRGEYQTARTVKKIADALNQPVRRYRVQTRTRRLAS